MFLRPAHIVTKSLLATLLVNVGNCQAAGEFEAASIKRPAIPPGQPIQPGDIGLSIAQGAVHVKNMKLRAIIGAAFRVAPIQIAGPKTLDDTFTIAAKLPAGANTERAPEMLQDLLQKRFGLIEHI